MKRHGSRLLMLLATMSIFASGCTGRGERGDASMDCPGLRSLDAHTATSDATKAFSRGKKSFLGVRGYSLDVPGVDESSIGKHEVVPIEGTSDAIRSPECKKLNEDAERYAAAYNETILMLLRRQETARPNRGK